MKYLNVLLIFLLAIVLVFGCSTERYDGVLVDIEYYSTANGDFKLLRANDSSIHIDEVGIAIGFTRIHLCDQRSDPTIRQIGLLRWLVPTAWAHSVSTPESSGIPVILSTTGHTPSIVNAALEPFRGVDVCQVEIQLLNSDHDAVMLEDMPEIEHYASMALIDGEWVGAYAGPSRFFDLEPPLRMEEDMTFYIGFDDDKWQQEIKAAQDARSTAHSREEVAQQLQSMALRSLTFYYERGVQTDTSGR